MVMVVVGEVVVDEAEMSNVMSSVTLDIMATMFSVLRTVTFAYELLLMMNSLPSPAALPRPGSRQCCPKARIAVDVRAAAAAGRIRFSGSRTG